MGTINAALSAIFDVLFTLVGWMPPMISLIIISGVVGIIFIWIFGKVSNQAGIKRAKDRVHCNLFLIRIYKDELGLTFKAMSKLLFFLIPYLGQQIIPLLILIGPFVLIAGQLNARYGYSPIEPGKRAVVKVILDDTVSPNDAEISLQASQGVEIETPGVRIPSQKEVDYRIRVDSPGEHTLTLTVNGETIEKKINATQGTHMVTHIRSAGFLDLLLFPGEAAIPGSSPVHSVEVATPIASMSFLGLSSHWLIWFLIFSLVVGFLLKGQFGVEI